MERSLISKATSDAGSRGQGRRSPAPRTAREAALYDLSSRRVGIRTRLAF